VSLLPPATVHTLPAPAEIWTDLVDSAEAGRGRKAGFGRRAGFTHNAAILVIDAQNYMVGPLTPDDTMVYPSSCGENGRAALAACARLIDTAREAGVPVIYTRFSLHRDGRDAGGYQRKRDLLDEEGWLITGTHGARIADQVAPAPGELVIDKKKPSAFFGTPVGAHLVDRGVDSVIVVGGSTSNCVRATAVDAASLNYRVVIPAECVFDRFAVSHRVTLFDLDRQYADVVRTDDLIAVLREDAARYAVASAGAGA
jgi:maleamate amidohydrolase